MTTVEVSEDALRRIKAAKDVIRKDFNIKMRMSDIMDHLVTSPDDMVERILESINKKMNEK